MTTRITFDLGDTPEAHFVSGDGRGHGDFAVIDLGGGVKAFTDTPAQCDALIRAAVAAKDLLLAAQPPLVMAPECARGNHAGCWNSTDGSHVCECCLNSHPGVPLSEYPAPPPAAHCPICGGELCGDGSHISANSGAHIPAEPQQVST